MTYRVLFLFVCFFGIGWKTAENLVCYSCLFVFVSYFELTNSVPTGKNNSLVSGLVFVFLCWCLTCGWNCRLKAINSLDVYVSMCLLFMRALPLIIWKWDVLHLDDVNKLSYEVYFIKGAVLWLAYRDKWALVYIF